MKQLILEYTDAEFTLALESFRAVTGNPEADEKELAAYHYSIDRDRVHAHARRTAPVPEFKEPTEKK